MPLADFFGAKIKSGIKNFLCTFFFVNKVFFFLKLLKWNSIQIIKKKNFKKNVILYEVTVFKDKNFFVHKVWEFIYGIESYCSIF